MKTLVKINLALTVFSVVTLALGALSAGMLKLTWEKEYEKLSGILEWIARVGLIVYFASRVMFLFLFIAQM